MAVSNQRDTVFTIPLSSLTRGAINPNQWVLCYLLHTQNWVALQAYLKDIGPWLRADIKDLHNREFITFKEVDFAYESSPRNLTPTSKFTDLLYGTTSEGETVDDQSLMIDDDEAFNELFHAYPAFINVNGSKAPGRSCDYEASCTSYSLATKGKRATHEAILHELAWGLEQGLVNMGLGKFIASRQWLSLRQARETGETGNVSFDNTDEM